MARGDLSPVRALMARRVLHCIVGRKQLQCHFVRLTAHDSLQPDGRPMGRSEGLIPLRAGEQLVRSTPQMGRGCLLQVFVGYAAAVAAGQLPIDARVRMAIAYASRSVLNIVLNTVLWCVVVKQIVAACS